MMKRRCGRRSGTPRLLVNCCCITTYRHVPVAQLDSASASGAEGYRFESCRGYFAKSLSAKRLASFCLMLRVGESLLVPPSIPPLIRISCVGTCGRLVFFWVMARRALADSVVKDLGQPIPIPDSASLEPVPSLPTMPSRSDVIKEIQKRNLQRRFANPKLRHIEPRRQADIIDRCSRSRIASGPSLA